MGRVLHGQVFGELGDEAGWQWRYDQPDGEVVVVRDPDHLEQHEPGQGAHGGAVSTDVAAQAQLTTTVAAALAVFCAGHAPTVLRSTDPVATAALIGVPMPLGDE